MSRISLRGQANESPGILFGLLDEDDGRRKGDTLIINKASCLMMKFKG